MMKYEGQSRILAGAIFSYTLASSLITVITEIIIIKFAYFVYDTCLHDIRASFFSIAVHSQVKRR